MTGYHVGDLMDASFPEDDLSSAIAKRSFDQAIVRLVTVLRKLDRTGERWNRTKIQAMLKRMLGEAKAPLDWEALADTIHTSASMHDAELWSIVCRAHAEALRFAGDMPVKPREGWRYSHLHHHGHDDLIEAAIEREALVLDPYFEAVLAAAVRPPPFWGVAA